MHAVLLFLCGTPNQIPDRLDHFLHYVIQNWRAETIMIRFYFSHFDTSLSWLFSMLRAGYKYAISHFRFVVSKIKLSFHKHLYQYTISRDRSSFFLSPSFISRLVLNTFLWFWFGNQIKTTMSFVRIVCFFCETMEPKSPSLAHSVPIENHRYRLFNWNHI